MPAMKKFVSGSWLALTLCAALCGAPGCGSGDGTADDSGDDDVVAGVDAAAPGGPDGGAVEGDWVDLLRGDWSLAAGDEGYFCVIATVDRDMYVKAFRPIAPLGTHHTVLTIYRGEQADGTFPCDVSTNGQNMIYGSGIGSPDYEFPTGIGLHFEAGTRLLLNLHLYNASDSPLSGTSGALVKEATAGEIENEAEMVLAGPTVTLYVPTGTTTQTGTCPISNLTSEPIHVFALSQHMHRLGRHMKSVIQRGEQQIVLQDIDYDFEVQQFHKTEPFIDLLPGDVLTTYCTYENTPDSNPPTGAPVTFGESSDDEMCFTDLFYYPRQGASFICTGI